MTIRTTNPVRLTRSIRTACLTSVGLLALCMTSTAQAQAVDAAAAQPVPAARPDYETSELGEILVTARREVENVQNIPVTVQVVSGESIQRLAITQPSEISKLTPGLTIAQPDPFNSTIVLRGVRWTQASGTPAIPVYLNEIPFDPVQVLQTLYDVGQVEVLRGPQGTLRGAPSISGAVLFGTHRPNLSDYGGYVYGQIGENDHQVLQGAVNIPIITDKLAVRFAGNYEDSQINQVRSVNNNEDPSLETRSYRASIRFEPNESISLNATYQHMDLDSAYYNQVAGSGSPGAVLPPPYPAGPNPFAPAGYNIAPNGSISPDDRLAVQEEPDTQYFNTDLFTVNASWDVFGQRISYNFGSQKADPDPARVSLDAGNMLPGFDGRNSTRTNDNSHYWNEVRISSIRGDHFFDYDIGYFNEQQRSSLTYQTIGFLLPGAFGNPFLGPDNPAVNPDAVNRYALRTESQIQLDTRSYSFYGNILLHLPYDTEFSAGVRTINDRRPSVTATTLFDTFSVASSAIVFGGACPAAFGLVASPVYDGYCDAVVPAASFGAVPVDRFDKTETPTLYNVSLSHKFTDSILGFATVGTSFRNGLPAIGNQGLPSELVFPEPEEATSYELGLKTSWGPNLRVNGGIFRIDYKNQLTGFAGIPYFDTTTGTTRATSAAFYSNVDAVVNGAELAVFARPTDGLTLGANVSYAKIESEGGNVPCAGPVSAANRMNFCAAEKGRTLNATSPFQASVNGSYTRPIGTLDGYVRFNASFQGRDPAFGASNEAFSAESYTIVDLFAGVTSSESWDLGLYAKNVFDENVVLSRNTLINSIAPGFGPTGLDAVRTTLPREVGVTLRYSFGSR